MSRVHIAGGRQALEGSRSGLGLELGPGVGMTGAPARESWLRPELAAPVPSFRLSGVCPGVPIVREEEASPPNPWNALVIERRRQETPIFPSQEKSSQSSVTDGKEYLLSSHFPDSVIDTLARSHHRNCCTDIWPRRVILQILHLHDGEEVKRVRQGLGSTNTWVQDLKVQNLTAVSNFR